MVLPDVNVLVYAHREDTPHHRPCLEWLESVVNGDESFALSELVLSGFLRVASHPKVFRRPSGIKAALEFCTVLHEQPHAVLVTPGPRHWDIFARLCGSGVRGNLVPDAYLAALAIEWGCEWVTTDRDFIRFKGLRWRHLLD